MVDTLSLDGKVAIITGSGRENGIGAAIAAVLARNGALVTINHVSPESEPRAAIVQKTIQDAGGRAIVVQADITTPEGSRKLVDETLKGFHTDHIDILGKFTVSLTNDPSPTQSKSLLAPDSRVVFIMYRCPRHLDFKHLGYQPT